jgi:hypothetical protein
MLAQRTLLRSFATAKKMAAVGAKIPAGINLFENTPGSSLSQVVPDSRTFGSRTISLPEDACGGAAAPVLGAC